MASRMSGPVIENPEKCEKSFEYGGELYCGYAFPSEPRCPYYNPGDDYV